MIQVNRSHEEQGQGFGYSLNPAAPTMLNEIRSNDTERFVEEAERVAHAYWPLLLIEGVALVLFGLLALLIPPLITIGIASALGWTLLFGGAAALLIYFKYRPPGFRRRIFLAVSSAIAGLAVLMRPVSGVISLTVLLLVCFALGGAAKLTYPLEEMRYLSRYRSWIRLSGLADLLLAGLMFFELPETALWVPGLLLAADMILGGMALVALALRRRSRPA